MGYVRDHSLGFRARRHQDAMAAAQVGAYLDRLLNRGGAATFVHGHGHGHGTRSRKMVTSQNGCVMLRYSATGGRRSPYGILKIDRMLTPGFMGNTVNAARHPWTVPRAPWSVTVTELPGLVLDRWPEIARGQLPPCFEDRSYHAPPAAG